MIVEHNNKIYQVGFVKTRHTATHKRKKVILIDTSCSIIMKDKPSDLWSEAHEVCSGESKQYITDRYSKVIGKKYALLDALRSLYDNWSPSSSRKAEEEGLPKFLECFTKAFRTALWKKFHETFGGWK